MFGGDSITFQYRYRKQIIIGCFLFIFIVAIIVYYYHIPKKEVKEIPSITKKEEKVSLEKEYLKVDIKGEVILPGIYSLEEGSRVIDVIDLAGGLTENADTTVINLSKKIVDEMVIIIYSFEEVDEFSKVKEMEEEISKKCIEGGNYSIQNDACIESDVSLLNNKVDINRASLEVLMTLPGIGEAKAKDIISYREEHGMFQEIEDIMNVNGIGESIYSQIKEIITV